ncbi:MAG: heavy-metal-associated domain-containing protein [Actinomycetota bacterium]
MTTTVLHISGMSCQNCVKHLTQALRGVAGVDTVEVSLEAASATVHSGGAVSHEAMKAAVEEAGYQLTA